jgi:hypothetical protein
MPENSFKALRKISQSFKRVELMNGEKMSKIFPIA